MNHKLIIKIVGVLLMMSVFVACKKSDYIVGGETQDVNMYKNMTTYEVLKSNTQFDTLVQLIDAAGLKETINQTNSTFFGVTNTSISKYLTERSNYVQATIDQNKKFLLDSLVYYLQNNIDGTRDSLLMYLIPGKTLLYSDLNKYGAIYQTALGGDSAAVSYEETKDESLGYNSLVSSIPKLIYFTQLWYEYDLSESNPASDIPESVGVRTRVQTSNMQSKNGVVHVLEGSHVLFFYGTK